MGFHSQKVFLDFQFTFSSYCFVYYSNSLRKEECGLYFTDKQTEAFLGEVKLLTLFTVTPMLSLGYPLCR